MPEMEHGFLKPLVFFNASRPYEIQGESGPCVSSTLMVALSA